MYYVLAYILLTMDKERWMFADLDPTTPAWALSVLGVLPVGYAILKLVDYAKSTRRKWRQDDHQLATEVQHAATEEQLQAKQNAAKEQVPVVERLLKEIADQNIEIADLKAQIVDVQTRERECSEERMKERTVLVILIQWAKKQKNPPPIPEEMIRDIEQGSRPHIPLQGTGS